MFSKAAANMFSKAAADSAPSSQTACLNPFSKTDSFVSFSDQLA